MNNALFKVHIIFVGKAFLSLDLNPKIPLVDDRCCVAKVEIFNSCNDSLNIFNKYFAMQHKFHNMKLNIAI
jgi:hypothetical protein